MTKSIHYSFIEPLAITQPQAVKMLGSKQILKRMMAARWVHVVRKGGPGRATLLDMESLKKAYNRWKQGELPPLTPGENGETIFLRS